MISVDASALEDAALRLLDEARNAAQCAGVDAAFVAGWMPGGANNPTCGLLPMMASAAVLDVARRRRLSALSDEKHLAYALLEAEHTVLEALAVGGDAGLLRSRWALGGERNPRRDGFAANALGAVAATVHLLASIATERIRGGEPILESLAVDCNAMAGRVIRRVESTMECAP